MVLTVLDNLLTLSNASAPARNITDGVAILIVLTAYGRPKKLRT
jgi:ribose/xylose/arabinose/galactoside ABC-type transport system permease subunit